MRVKLFVNIDQQSAVMKQESSADRNEPLVRWMEGPQRPIGVSRWFVWTLGAAAAMLLLGAVFLLLFRSRVKARTRELSGVNEDLMREVAVREQAQQALSLSEQRYHDIFTALPTSMWEEDFSSGAPRLFALRQQHGNGLRAYFENNPQEMMDFSADIRIIDVNPAGLALSGAASLQEFIDNFQNLFCEETAPAFLGFLVDLAEGKTKGANIETALRSFTGEMRDMQLAWAVATGHEHDLSRIWFSLVDITSRKKAERALKHSEEKYRLLSETARDLIAMHDMNGRITYVNPAGLLLLGFAWDQIQILNVTDLIAPGDLDAMRKRMARRTEKDSTVFLYEVDVRTRDGRSVPLEISSSLVMEDGKPRGVLLTGRDITERRATQAQLELYRRHLEDLVDERTRELQEAREQLLAAERLALLGRFAGNISHEIRNPLGVISNSAYFLDKLLAGSDQARVHKHLEIIQRKVRDCTGIIESILRLTNMEKPAFATLDTGALLLDILSGMEFPDTIRVHSRIPEQPVNISADKEQLRMAVSNMIRNGVQAMPEGGVLTVAVDTGTMDNNQILKISVSDTGPGIPDENLEKIFQPLFTTKSQGMGFGLPLAKMVAQAHGGDVSVRANDPEGAMFTMTFPITQELP